MDFSGVWSGFYIYLKGYNADYFGEKVKFLLRLESKDGVVKGVCEEDESEFSVMDTSVVKGLVNDDGYISFILQYPSLVFITEDGETFRNENQIMTVCYEGEYDEITDTFFGDWYIDEIVLFEEDEFYLEGSGVWKMTRQVEGGKGSSFDEIYKLLEYKFNNMHAIKNRVLFNIEGNFVHINGNGLANSLSTANQDADCVISIPEKNIMDILEKKISPTFLFDEEIKTEGDIGVVMKIQTLLTT